MKRVFFALLLSCFVSVPAFAEPPTPAQMAEFYKLVDNGDITNADLEAFLAAHRSSKASPQKPVGCMVLKVDYSPTFEAMASESGGYHNFFQKETMPTPRGEGGVKRELCWFQLGIDTDGSRSIDSIVAFGTYMHADLWELRALKLARPDLAKQYPAIAALGSIGRVRENGILKEGREVLPVWLADGTIQFSARYGSFKAAWLTQAVIDGLVLAVRK